MASRLGARPERPLELYDFEACPFCRKVRETATYLDLPVLMYPCPKGGTRFRPRAEALGGAARFPFLVDPNRGKQLYESTAIIRYLAETYGTGAAPLSVRLGPLSTFSSGLATAASGGIGRNARSSRPAQQPLELFGFEGSPQARLVRATLCELELPYLLHNAGRGSAAHELLVARSGATATPWLHDPNTGTSAVGAAAITAHLEQTYAA